MQPVIPEVSMRCTCKMFLIYVCIQDNLPNADISAENIRDWSRRFLQQMPPLNYNVLVYVLSLFREVLAHKEHNKLTPSKLGE
jgi:hypothetical protein